jgi:Lipase (class 3)
LAQLDALYFTLNLPSNVAVKAITYGTPRVGNPAYASYFDDMVSLFFLIIARSNGSITDTLLSVFQVSDYQRVNNMHDVVPIVPAQSWGYRHPHGEVHLLSFNDAVACSGQCHDPTSRLL